MPEQEAKPYTPPSTLKGIKRLAKAIKKEQGVTHTTALTMAANKAGYQNYSAALAALGE